MAGRLAQADLTHKVWPPEDAPALLVVGDEEVLDLFEPVFRRVFEGVKLANSRAIRRFGMGGRLTG